MGDSCRDQGAAAQVNVTSNLTTLLHCAPSHSKTTVYRRWFHVYSPEFGRVYKRMTLDNLRATIYSIEGSQLTIGSAYGYWHMTRSTFLRFKRDVIVLRNVYACAGANHFSSVAAAFVSERRRSFQIAGVWQYIPSFCRASPLVLLPSRIIQKLKPELSTNSDL